MKKGFTCGSFDLLHAGHIKMLEEAKTKCDYLIVGLQEDPSIDRDYKNKPIQTLEERNIQLSAVKYVDEIVVYKTEKDLLDLIKSVNPDVRILGVDHKNRNFTGHELSIDLYFNSRDHAWSTSDLRKRIFIDEYFKFEWCDWEIDWQEVNHDSYEFS
tara:strand:- start:2239 stop:2709 length:471 start_codon:yes stop_codon:yes gene_type:complete